MEFVMLPRGKACMLLWQLDSTYKTAEARNLIFEERVSPDVALRIPRNPSCITRKEEKRLGNRLKNDFVVVKKNP
jgi:hypothetical protein